MRGWALTGLRLVVPLAAALLLIGLERSLTALAAARPGILPVAMALLLAGLMTARFRHWLIVTLCFGIAVMAFRDTLRSVSVIGHTGSYAFVGIFYPIGWALLAMLAVVAGTMEALAPGTVWARRCYFAGAALYLGGHGLIGYVQSPNWQSLILFACGAVALTGVVTAHRIVAAEAPPPPEPEDLRSLAEDMRRRSERITSKEWH